MRGSIERLALNGHYSLLSLTPIISSKSRVAVAAWWARTRASVDEDKALTRAIIAMGRTLSLTVVAQGVETKAQADFLRLNACDEFQGFYLDVPMPADQTSILLRTQGDVAISEAGATA